MRFRLAPVALAWVALAWGGLAPSAQAATHASGFTVSAIVPGSCAITMTAGGRQLR
jgi:hypothetical protein